MPHHDSPRRAAESPLSPARRNSASRSPRQAPRRFFQRHNVLDHSRVSPAHRRPPSPPVRDLAHLRAVRNRRLMKEYREITRHVGAPDGAGFTVELVNDCLYEWNIHLFHVDRTSDLWRDMRDLHVRAIQLNMAFPENFPFSPPFLRVLSPRIERGFVMEGGAICMELLTPRGWASAYTIEAIIMQFAASLVKGQVGLLVSLGKGQVVCWSASSRDRWVCSSASSRTGGSARQLVKGQVGLLVSLVKGQVALLVSLGKGQVGLLVSLGKGQVSLLASLVKGQVALLASFVKGQVGLLASLVKGQVGPLASLVKGQVGLLVSLVKGQGVCWSASSRTGGSIQVCLVREKVSPLANLSRRIWGQSCQETDEFASGVIRNLKGTGGGGGAASPQPAIKPGQINLPSISQESLNARAINGHVNSRIRQVQKPTLSRRSKHPSIPSSACTAGDAPASVTNSPYNKTKYHTVLPLNGGVTLFLFRTECSNVACPFFLGRPAHS